MTDDDNEFFRRRKWEPPEPTPNREAPVLEDVLDVGDDDQPISPRQWLMEDTFCREFMSGLIAPGGGAKTSLRIVQGLSLRHEHTSHGSADFSCVAGC